MSGLCAVATFDGAPVAHETVQRMSEAVPHRASAGLRVWDDDGIVLAAMARLDDPARPVVSAGAVAVVDGRVDNADEVRDSLLRAGRPVPDDVGDPELVLACCRAWGGGGAVQRLVGDYAFVVWDVAARRLVAGRDPMGQRILHYRVEPRRRVLVATEAVQLLAAPGVPREPHEAAFAAALCGPSVPTSWSFWDGIDQLEPGHVLTVDASGARVEVGWAPDPSARLDPADDAEAAELLRGVFSVAVAARLRGETPTGILLSGGVDSSLTAATAGTLRPRPPLQAYQWAFTELASCDERDVSGPLVDHYGLEGVPVPGDDAWPLSGATPDVDDPMTWVYQELFERSFGLARGRGAGRVLVSERGDQVVGDWVYDELGMVVAVRMRDAWADLRRRARDTGRPLVLIAADRILGAGLRSVLPSLGRRRRLVRPPWVREAFAARTGVDDVLVAAATPGRPGGHGWGERHQRIFGWVTHRTAALRERTAARCGVEQADPWSDRRVVELVLSLPQWRVQRWGRPKALARGALRGLAPETVVDRVGPRPPLALYRRGLLEREVATVRGLLTGMRAADLGWVDEAEALAAYERELAGRPGPYDWWLPLSVERWLRQCWGAP